MSHKSLQHTTVERQWYRQQTDGTKQLPRGAQCQSGGHSGIQAHGKFEKSKLLELHPSTTGSTPRPRRSLTVFIHNSVNFTRKPRQQRRRMIPTYKNLPSASLWIIQSCSLPTCTPPGSSCNGYYSPPIDHLLSGTDSLVLGDFNAHHSLWHSGTTDTRGNQLADSVSISSFAVLNTD